MSIFPSLIPSTRIFTPGEYPHTAYQAWSGIESRVRHSNAMLSSSLRLIFVAIDEADMLSILSHYNGRQGGYLAFAIPSQLLSGVSAAADYTLTGYQWRYVEPPIIDDIPCAGHSVEIVLETVPLEATVLSGLDSTISIELNTGVATAANGIQSQIVISLAGGLPYAQGADLTPTISFDPGAVSVPAETSGIEILIDASLVAGSAAAANGFEPVLTMTFAAGSATVTGGPAPTYVNASNIFTSSAGISVPWPTTVQSGDIGILVLETSGNDSTVTISSPSGWDAVPGSPVTDIADATGSKLQVFWKRHTGSESSVTVPDPGDHVVGRMFAFRGCAATGNPWNAIATDSKTTASTTATTPSVTTTDVNTLIVMIVGRPNDSNATNHFGAPVNANLTSIAERGEAGAADGNGGGFVLATGVKATAGATGTATLTKSVSTTDTYMVIALR